MNVAIAGASGFVGRALTAHLLGSGHDVVALGRSVNSISTGARAVSVDVGDEVASASALVGVDVAYYLVHSMGAGGGFREVDLRLATAFGRAAAKAGVGRIVYVGALGNAASLHTWQADTRWVRPSPLPASSWSSFVPRWYSARAASPSKCSAI